MTSDDTFVIDTPAQLKALADPLRQRLLQSLVKPATAKVLALRLGEPITKLYHHLDQLLATGLVKVVREEKRRAVVERTFAASARRFAVRPGAYGNDVASGDRRDAVRNVLDDVVDHLSPVEDSVRLLRISARLTASDLERLECEIARLVEGFETHDATPFDIVLVSSRRL